MKELDSIQRKFGKAMLEVPRGTPDEFVQKEVGFSSQSDRVERARIKLFRRMIENEGKTKKTIVENWAMDGGWIREVKENLRHNGILEEEVKEMDIKEVERRIKERRKEEWRQGVQAKSSLKWYKKIVEKGKSNGVWMSEEKDRIMKRFWCGVMERELRECTVCDCEERRGVDRVEHWLRWCGATEWWRREYDVDNMEVDEILSDRGEALMELEKWRQHESP